MISLQPAVDLMVFLAFKLSTTDETGMDPSKRLPRRLEHDLNNQPRYKPNGRPGSASKRQKPAANAALKAAMNKNVEQAMFDEILGPLVNHNSNRRPASTSSPIRSPSGKGGVGAVGGLLRPGSASKRSSEESKEDMAFLKGVYNSDSKEGSEGGSSSVKSTSESGKSNDSSFTTSILSRLASVEKENKDLRKQLANTATKVDNLEHENKKLSLMLEDKDEEEYNRQKEKRKNEISSSPTRISSIHGDSQKVKLLEENKDLRDLNADLENQLMEMEKFLADYGLVWVGNEAGASNDSGEDSKDVQTEKEVFKLGGNDGNGKMVITSSNGDKSEGKEDVDAVATANMPKGVDYVTFAKKVSELNDIIYSEPALIKKEKFNDKQARLMQPSEYYDSVPVTLYLDGILVKRGPFRENGSAGYTSFVRDVMEGYFPTDFREEYPDGVILSLKDRHLERYIPGGSGSSKRNGLGGLARGGSNLLGSSVSMGKDQLLSRLPVNNVSASGDVREVRGPIEGMLSGAAGAGAADAKLDSEASSKEARERARNARLARLGAREASAGEGVSATSVSSQPKTSSAVHDRRTEVKSPECEDSKSSKSDDEGDDEEEESVGGSGSDAPPSYQLSNLMSSPGYRGNSGAGATDVPPSHRTDGGRGPSGGALVATPADSAKDLEDTALVKVRWLDGNNLSVRLYNDELVGDLCEHIKRHFYNFSEDGCPLFELRSAYPPKVLRGGLTLKEAGLVPNGIVHAKAVTVMM